MERWRKIEIDLAEVRPCLDLPSLLEIIYNYLIYSIKLILQYNRLCNSIAQDTSMDILRRLFSW